eukprot:SAG31_NODE_4849_length_2906_cov_2.398290_3_plen_125_part_00
MANHTKNILVRTPRPRPCGSLRLNGLAISNGKVGTGGKEAIDQSHFVGAVFGMENIMGRRELIYHRIKTPLPDHGGMLYGTDDNPVRQLYNKAWNEFCSHLPVVWMQVRIVVFTATAHGTAKPK